MMEFGILGPLEAWVDGRPIDLGPHKQRALLALLLIHVDRVVPTDRILDALWGDDAAGKENALWVHISRLRSALEPHRAERGESSMLITRDHGYLIRSDPSSVDARRFESALSDARARLADEPEAASEILRRALDLWRGSALQDFAFDAFASAEIARLDELRLQAVETRIEADLRRGLAGQLIGELERLVYEHPLREGPVVQLMHALYRAGRQAEALRAFQRFRRGIAEELGIEPSPELCRLEEQILLHDPRLISPTVARRATPATATLNPFKGLHAFREADAEDFFGRDRLVAEVVGRVSDGAHLVALVGPSGSGKSSIVRAGVVPALRKGALAGSERWLFASMVPGAHPFAELEAALLRSTIDAPDSLSPQLEDHTLGMLRAVLRLLPDDMSRLVLVIDQFEELFTLVEDEAERRRFLVNLVAAIDDPHARLVVVLTLRADSYHRPLEYRELAARLSPSVVNVLPLTSDELESAAQEPAARSGVRLEPALLAELLADVIGEPGALPLFQYALTELFDRREGDVLTVAAYRAMGGVRGALSRRADDLYHRLTLDEQEAARQLFLRLVSITEHENWGRRRVPASEIVSMGIDVVTMESVIDQLGRHRFLAFDRDHSTGAPTVEVAHEALLWEWDRVRDWIDEGRHDIQRRASLDAAAAEWVQANRDDDYLFVGNRLAGYEHWRATTSMRLTAAELDFLDASRIRQDDVAATKWATPERETIPARPFFRRRWGLLVAGAPISPRHPKPTWGYIDAEVPGSPCLMFAEHEGSFLVGAAAALTSMTGTIGFVGGFQIAVVERFRAGFEAGARAVCPSIDILATYLDYYPMAFERDDLARAAASDIYQRGADVVFQAAGFAGCGVFAAARAASTPLRHLWAIGADTDQFLEVDPSEKQHVLTSMIKRFDVAASELVRQLVIGELRPGVRSLGLADNALGYSTTGGHLSAETIARLEHYRSEIVAGTRVVPSAPNGALAPPLGKPVSITVNVTFDGATCRHDAPDRFTPGVARVVFVNTSDRDGLVEVSTAVWGMVQVPAIARETNSGYAMLEDGHYIVQCRVGDATFAGGTLRVGS
jgi:basic membrane lipoprotein Med (substrate-binding protein (PBP1-ABC) superfamily)/DNA-binding SARP family transcriptional activator